MALVYLYLMSGELETDTPIIMLGAELQGNVRS